MDSRREHPPPPPALAPAAALRTRGRARRVRHRARLRARHRADAAGQAARARRARRARRPAGRRRQREHQADRPPARRRQPRSGGDNGGAAGQLTSSPLLSGASGRLWIAKDGRVRLELQAEKGDTQILYDGHTVSMYDAVDQHALPLHDPGRLRADTSNAPTDTSGAHHEAPSVAKIEEAIAHSKNHANVSGATPTDVAGQAAYTVRVSPKEGGSLIGGAELSWDAVHGVPLRAAIYSSTSSSSPVIELAATRSLLRPGRRLGVRLHAPAGRQDPRNRPARERAPRQPDRSRSHAQRRTSSSSAPTATASRRSR